MRYFALFLVPALFFVGCGEEPQPDVVPVVVSEVVPEPEPVVVLPKLPLTMKMIHALNLSSQDICNLQLYTSHDIELQRKIPASSSSIDNGVLVVNNEDKILRMVIKKGTPCIAIEAEDNYIVVKFSENFTLTFMYTRGKKDLFLLTANKWKNGKGSLVINEKEYEAVGTSGQAYLMLSKKDMDNSDEKETIIEGSFIESH